MLFFDFEVTKYDWLVVILDTDSRSETVIVNDVEKLREFHDIHKGSIWVGYNSTGYDQYILKGILCGFDPKEINDFIIVEGRKGWEYSAMLHRIPLNVFDCMERIDRGLKFLEGSMGVAIHETTVPFDIDRELTEAEIQEMIDYCRWDVEQTMNVFMARYSDFDSRLGLVNEYGLPLKNISKTKTQLASIILDARSRGGEFSAADKDQFDLRLPDTLKLSEKYQYIADWYLDPANQDYEKKLKVDVAGVEHVFAWGGLHGALEGYYGEGIYVMMDVASLYPSLMIEYDLMSRGVADPSKYRQIRDQRLEYKAAGDPRQAALKLVLNSCYGALKDKYNPLYDPRQANLVCIFGQLLLLDLVDKMEQIPGVKLIQSNTDGILVKLPDWDAYDLVDDVAHEWEKRTRLDLEFETFHTVAQGDVNNYVIVGENGVKTKGGWVKTLNDLDYDLAVVNRAIVDYIAKGVPVRRTIMNCRDMRDFQLIVKASSLYDGIWHGGQKLNERTVRCYAVKSGGKPLTKVHLGRGNRVKCAGTPENSWVTTDDVLGKSVSDNLDREWYVRLAEERVKKFGKG